jgi:hypothetical protein
MILIGTLGVDTKPTERKLSILLGTPRLIAALSGYLLTCSRSAPCRFHLILFALSLPVGGDDMRRCPLNIETGMYFRTNSNSISMKIKIKLNLKST